MNTIVLDLNIQLPEHGRVGGGSITESQISFVFSYITHCQNTNAFQISVVSLTVVISQLTHTVLFCFVITNLAPGDWTMSVDNYRLKSA